MARKQEISKGEILQKAKQLIEAEGFSMLSIRNLAEKCMVAVGTIYLYFENKMQLLVELASGFWDKCFEILEGNTGEDFFGEMRYAYFHILDYLEAFKTDWLSGFSMMSSMDKEQGKKMMEQYVGKIRGRIMQSIEKYKHTFNTEFFKTLDAEYFAGFLYGNLMSMLMRYSHNYEPFDMILKKILL